MASLTNNVQLAILNQIYTGQSWPYSSSQLFVSLHNADPNIGGSQNTNETIYSNYARVAVNCVPSRWNAVGSNPATVMNSFAVTFPQCGGIGDIATWWGVGLNPTGPGTLLQSGPIGAGPVFGFVSNNNVLTVPGSQAVVNARCIVFPLNALPPGLVEGTVYYVGTVNGNNITLSTLANNAAPVTAGLGFGVLIPVSPLVIAQGNIPIFPPNSLVAYMN